MTTLSLFDEPTTLETPVPEAERPVSTGGTGRPANAAGAEASGGVALDPDAVRELLPPVRPVRAGGLTLPVLAFAALIASPAIWQCLVRHAVPIHVMLERYVVIAIGCLLVSEAARRLLPQVSADATDDETTGPGGSPGGGVGRGVGGDLASVDGGGQAPADTLVMPAATTPATIPAIGPATPPAPVVAAAGAGPIDPALALLAAER